MTVNPEDRTGSIQSVISRNFGKRKKLLLSHFEKTIQLPSHEKQAFCDMLTDYHKAFCLDDGERGETGLVKLHIDTGDTPPKGSPHDAFLL